MNLYHFIIILIHSFLGHQQFVESLPTNATYGSFAAVSETKRQRSLSLFSPKEKPLKKGSAKRKLKYEISLPIMNNSNSKCDTTVTYPEDKNKKWYSEIVKSESLATTFMLINSYHYA